MNRFTTNVVRLVLALALVALPGAGKEKKGGKAGDQKPTAKSSDAKSAKAAPATPVDINSASQSELDSLPGVGAATAKKIIAGRPYSSAADLAKAGVPAKTIQQITPMIVVGPANAQPSASASAKKVKAAAATVNSTPATSTSNSPGVTPPPAPTKAQTKPATTASRQYTPPPAPGMVWVNPDTKVYHQQGDRWYGKTKDGKYMTETDAIKSGYRPAKK